ncbi:hypothetical protein ACTWP5_17910 [Streptomyces sp. 4N509B]|uniref:hypothetical protein n=1 Tax=Streptomyces sp. 4N509B TaxID=3457413 RepID=UPI003FCF7CF5
MPVIHDQTVTRVAPEAVVVEPQPVSDAPAAVAAATPTEARRNVRREQARER